MASKQWVKAGIASLALVVACFVLVKFYVAHAADGSGNASVTPTSIRAGTTGTFVFTTTSTEAMSSGEVAITVPSSWTAPQGTAGVAGYTTAISTSGVIATVLDNADSTTGWSAGTACTNGLSTSSAVKQEGTASLACANGNEAQGDVFYKNITAQDWTNYTTVGFWIRTTAAISSGNLRFAYDNNTNLASPIATKNVPALSANAWTYVTVTLSGARTSVLSYGFQVNQKDNLDGVTVYVDDLLIGPGTPTFPGGGDVRVRLLSLASGQSVKVTYGANGGASGATAPTTTGAYVFTEKTRISDSGVLQTIGTSPSIQVTAAPATRFVISPPGDGTVGTAVPVTVRALDQYGNVDTTYQSDVTLNVNGSATGGGLVNIVNGVGTRSVNDTVAETVHVTLTDSQGTGLNVSSNQDIAFAAGPTARYLLNHPGDLVAGNRLGYVVTREDSYGNRVTNGSDSVYLYTNSLDPDPGFYDASSGGNSLTVISLGTGTSTGVFWYADDKAGSVTVTASDHTPSADGAAGIADAQDTFTVLPASVASFSLSHPGDLMAGSRLGFVATRQDPYGNPVSSGALTAYLYSDSTGAHKAFYPSASGGASMTSVDFADGSSTASFWYFDDKASSVSLTISDRSGTPDGSDGIDDAFDAFAVLAGPTAKLSLDDPGDMTAGTRIGYTVTREDAYGNLVTSGSDTALLSSSSVGTSTRFYDAVSGGSVITSVTISPTHSTAAFWYGDDAVGNWVVTASEAGVSDGTDPIQVLAGSIVATRFVIDPTGAGTAGSSVTVTVKAEDGLGNVDSTFQQNVTLNASDHATGGGVVDIVDGVGTIDISDTVAETSHLTLTDSQGTGLDVASTRDVVFSPGPTARYLLNHPGNLTAGSRLAYSVSRQDAHGNAVTAGSVTVYLYSSGAAGTARFYDADSGGAEVPSLVISEGHSSAPVWYEDTNAAAVTVTASDHEPSADGPTGIDDATDTFTVLAGPTAKFILNDPGDMTVGTRIGYTVTREDAYGNLVTSGSDTAHLFSNASGTASAFYSASSGGSVILSKIIADGLSSASFWYAEGTVGMWTVTASDNAGGPDAFGILDGTDDIQVSILSITATRFVIRPVSDSPVGGSATVTIRAEDSLGNVDTTYQQDVTLNLSGSATGGGLVDIVNGIGTATISDAVAETVHLTLEDTQGTGLIVTSSQSAVFGVTSTGSLAGSSIGSEYPSVTIVVRTVLRITGQAYPEADLALVGHTPTGDKSLMKETVTSADGSFAFEYTGPFQDITSYEVQISDRDGRPAPPTSVEVTATIGVVTERHISVAPTIGLLWLGELQGIPLKAIGYAVPQGDLVVLLDGNPVPGQFSAGSDGKYQITLDTIGMVIGVHTVAVRQKLADGSLSGSSTSKRFVVTNSLIPQSDLNQDGRVDISDWSIFLFRWSSDDPVIKDLLDMNNDGKVDISDFSIFIRSIRQHL